MRDGGRVGCTDRVRDGWREGKKEAGINEGMEVQMEGGMEGEMERWMEGRQKTVRKRETKRDRSLLTTHSHITYRQMSVCVCVQLLACKVKNAYRTVP